MKEQRSREPDQNPFFSGALNSSFFEEVGDIDD
jgi:hypothetical protein